MLEYGFKRERHLELWVQVCVCTLLCGFRNGDVMLWCGFRSGGVMLGCVFRCVCVQVCGRSS